MPIIRNFGPTQDSTVLTLGYGDVHIAHAIYVDPLTRLPELEKSMMLFVEFDPAVLKNNPEFKLPEPGASLVFANLEMVDRFIENIQQFKAQYLKQMAQLTKTAAQA